MINYSACVDQKYTHAGLEVINTRQCNVIDGKMIELGEANPLKKYNMLIIFFQRISDYLFSFLFLFFKIKDLIF